MNETPPTDPSSDDARPPPDTSAVEPPIGYGPPPGPGMNYGPPQYYGPPPGQPQYYGQPPGPPPYYGPPPPGQFQPPPKRSHKMRNWLLGLGAAAIAMIVIIAIATSGSDEPDTASGEAEEGEAAEDGVAEDVPAAPGIGDEARDGNFAFVVESVERAATVGTDEFLTETAQGEYVLVRLSVENIGDAAQMFSDSDQTLIDVDGKRHSTDTDASFAVNPDELIWEEINPGNSIDVTVPFDVPVDTELDKIELHDSSFSDGVEVLLD